MTRFLEPGTPTGVGSLPYDDAAAAARHELHVHRELPAAPQLPNRSAAEGMLAQVAAGMGGVRIADDGWSLAVDRRSLSAGAIDAPLDADAFGGLLTFLDEAKAIGHTGPVKVQLTGSITLGLALARGGAKPSKAFSIAEHVVGGRLAALVATVQRALPTSPIVVMLDEPGLTAYLDPSFPLGAEDTIDLLSHAMATATSSGITGADVIAGVHCCGPTDWRLVLHAGPDLVSLPVEATAGDDGAGFSTFLDRGGFIAWGAVPTDRPIGQRDDIHWRRLNGLWAELARSGCDPVRLRTQALLTPSCGLARHHDEQVAPVFGLVRRLAERVQDQAIAARMSAGA